MGDKLKLLFVEDMIESFELAEYELKKAGIEFESERVENSYDFEVSLKKMNPDIVISDYYLPQFNGMLALKITKSYDESIPFIILTGNLNEEIAVECMKAGANDYVLKDHLSRLPFAIREAMKHRETLLEKKKAEIALLESEKRYRNIFEKNFAAMMIINPEDGTIVDANASACSFYGYTNSALFERTIFDLTAKEAGFSKELLALMSSGSKKHLYSSHITKSGVKRDVEIFCSPVVFWGKVYVHLIIHDITERNRALNALKNSLNTNRELIREIFHRTKNNLQVIISMLGLQSMYFEDERLLKAFKEMEDRIKAMALVHEKLYKSQSLSRLPLNEYIFDLVSNIKSSYGIGDEIELIFDMEQIEVLIDIALPCGIIINELVTNVFRHAYGKNQRGILRIVLSRVEDNKIEIIVEDEGSGKGKKVDLDLVETMGLRIVKNIAEYQLNGEIALDTSKGFGWRVRFIDNLYGARV